MRALTICQPYAELILRGLKRVENRTWSIDYRGAILIHAGQSKKFFTADNYGIGLAEMDFGAVVGVAQVRGCIAFHPGKRLDPLVLEAWPWLDGHVHCEGPYCWILEDVFRFQSPVPFRGFQGIFHVPNDLVAAGLLEAMQARKEKPA
jgi:hypothetical protein